MGGSEPAFNVEDLHTSIATGWVCGKSSIRHPGRSAGIEWTG